MGIEIMHAVVLRDGDGGDRVKIFEYENDALEEAQNLVEDLKRAHLTDHRVYVTELEYDGNLDRVVSDRFVTDQSILIG